MRKRTIQAVANTAKSMEKYEDRPFFKKKYVMNRTNSLKEAERLYVYLLGSTKGWDPFKKKLQRLQPEAKRMRGKNVEWHFDTEFLWDMFNENEKMRNIIEKRKIESMEEMSGKLWY